MSSVGPSILAFCVAAFLSLLELVTSKYPQTFFLVRKSWAFFTYGVIYGLLALGATLGLNALSAAGAIKLEGLGMSSPWIRAIAIGVSFKALLHIRLFSVTAGSEAFPIGVETFVQLFEPPLTRRILFDHFNALQRFIGPRAEKYADLDKVKEDILQNVPELPEQERTAFLADIQQTTSVKRAMERYLSLVGRPGFDRVFPPS